ncbi:hypothetical protein CALCODRAFT_151722 [Calocera cornea HHB12733]|uniref:Uncharacterized protein n=1 Tax=Calocera cornea HHB12733 TaxID=1353952 RepID=A0A165CPK3_9BASI|nr:hypothetical protein CALCODRAFT_151722 [Calocera cornea HHB12733]
MGISVSTPLVVMWHLLSESHELRAFIVRECVEGLPVTNTQVLVRGIHHPRSSVTELSGTSIVQDASCRLLIVTASRRLRHARDAQRAGGVCQPVLGRCIADPARPLIGLLLTRM